MQRSLFHNNIQPSEQVLDYLAQSLVQQILKRFRDFCGRGIRRGLRVTVNATNALTFDISPGAGYTPNGELVELDLPITGLALDQQSLITLRANDVPVSIRGNGSYDPLVSARNYVILRYTEELAQPGKRRDAPDIQIEQIAIPRFEVEVLTQAAFEQLTRNDDSDASAVQDLADGSVGLPTAPPWPSRQFRVLLAIVTPRGEGVALTPADIQEADPGVTQPEDIHGVQIINVSPQTPTGTGFLRWNVKDQTLSWQAPADSSPGVALALPTDAGIYTLESRSSTNESVSIRVQLEPATVRALPTDIEEPIGVVPRLELMFPQPSQANPAISGLTVRTVTTNTPVGDTILRFDRAARTLQWDVPGSGPGPLVNVSGGGNFVLRPGPLNLQDGSSTSPYAMNIFVSETALPAGSGTDQVTVSIRSLYEQDVPLATALDLLHRSFVGRGIPTARNPHGLTIEDIFESGGEDILATHQDLYHLNGISIDAAPDFLRATVTPDDRVQVVPSTSSSDRFLIQGITFSDVKNVDVQFTDTDETGYWLVYVDSNAVLTRARICAAPDFSPIAYTAALPEIPPIRIVEVRRSTTSGSSGRLTYRPSTGRFFWRGPGSSTTGVPVVAGADITVYDGQNKDDYIRLQIDTSKLRLDLPAGSPVNIDIQFFTDANTVNIENSLPLMFGLWNQGPGGTESFIESCTFDLRRFATADVREQLYRALRDLQQSSYQRTLYERLLLDRRENLDNGISTAVEHGTVGDEDPNAGLVSRSSASARVVVQQPSSALFYVRGRRYEAIVYDPQLPPGKGGGGYGPAGAPPDVVDLTPRWDFTADPSDNAASAPEAACLLQLYLDEFGRLNSHVRVLEDDDVASKAIAAFVISDISEDFPAGNATWQMQPNTPATSFYSFAVKAPGESSFGQSVVMQRTGRSVRAYAANGRDWIEITNIFALALPGAGATTTFIVNDPIDKSRCLELARVAYDGSAEIVTIKDRRRFGSVGRRSLGTDALAITSKTLHDGLHGETRSSGVVRGLTFSFTRGDPTLRWDGGVVVVNGTRLVIPGGEFTNTVPGSTGLRNRYMVVNQDGSIDFSGGHGEAHVVRDGVIVAILYIQDSALGIDYVEDRRFFPSLVPWLNEQQVLPLARKGQVFLREGIIEGNDFSAPLSSFPDGTTSITLSNFAAYQGFNVHVTTGPGVQGQLYWLDDEAKDGLVFAAIQNFDPSRVAGTTPGLPIQSNFGFFLVPAGKNPRLPSQLIYLGAPSTPVAVRKGGLVVYPTQIIDIADNLTLTSPATGQAVVAADDAPTPPGGGDGTDVRPFGLWTGAFANQGAAAGQYYLGAARILSFNAPSSGYRMNLEINVTLDSGSGGSRSPVCYVIFDTDVMTVNGGSDEVHESVPQGSEGANVHFSLGNISVSSGTHTIGLVLYGREGSTVSFDGRIHIAGFISKAL